MRPDPKPTPKKKDPLCDQCEQPFKKANALQKVCSQICAIKWVKANPTEVKKVADKTALEKFKAEKKAEAKKKKEGLEKLKTLSDWKKDLEKEINHIVRLIDFGHECISSGAKEYQVNAGHMYSVGSFPALRFNLLNIYNQSVHDNMHKGGNGVIYKERIKEVFGQEVSDEIEGLKSKYPSLNLRIPEVKEAIKTAREAVRYLKKHQPEEPYSIEERINLRHYYNQLINIYK